jgi:hypothetical protein
MHKEAMKKPARQSKHTRQTGIKLAVIAGVAILAVVTLVGAGASPLKAIKDVSDPSYGTGWQQTKKYPFRGTQSLTYYYTSGRITYDVVSPLGARRPPTIQIYGQCSAKQCYYKGKMLFPIAITPLSYQNKPLSGGGWEVTEKAYIDPKVLHQFARKNTTYLTGKSERGYITMRVKFKN